MIVLERETDPNLLRRRLFASVAMAALTLASATADAQIAYGNADPSVIVDLSVLDDGGFGAGSSAGFGAASSVRPGVIGASGQPRLLMPGAQAPASTLHVPPPVERRSIARAPVERPAALRPLAPTAAAPAAVMPPSPPARPSPPVLAATPLATPLPPAATIAPPAASSSTTTAALPAPPPPPTIAAAPTPRQTPMARTEPAAPVQATPAPAAPTPAQPPRRETSAPAAPRPPAAPQAAPRADDRPTEQAARPAVAPDAVKGPVPAMTVPFGADASRVPPAAQEQLKALANQMKDKAEARIQLVAYASGDELTSSRARRLSLSRALAVRSVLIDLGVRSTRIDVRALGDKAADDPQNRVDVIVTER